MSIKPPFTQNTITHYNQGFTLLELLIAVAIMGFIAVLCWQALDSLIRTREHINADMAGQKALQRFFLQFDYDCVRIASEGPDAFPVMALEDGFMIVRRLKHPPQYVWQTVAYRTKDQTLWRIADEGVTNLQELIQTGHMMAQYSLPSQSTNEQVLTSPDKTANSQNFSLTKLIEKTSTPILRVWNHQLMQWELMPTNSQALNSRLQADSTLYAAFESPKALQIQFEIQKKTDIKVNTATILAKDNDPSQKPEETTVVKEAENQDKVTQENYVRTCLTGV